MKRTSTQTRLRPDRQGFSLIELMVVIVIIGILMALIIPALQGTVRRGRIMEASSEITRLNDAIANFQGDFKVIPSSELVLTEDPSVTAWDASPALVLSRSRIRRVWPSFTFSGQIDFNGDGAFDGDSGPDATITLTGSECLVFFLGGMLSLQSPSTPQNLMGFSKNPLDPFTRAGSNRTPVYFNFDIGRFRDFDEDGMPEYLDTLPDQKTPLHFASSNNGQGYSATQFIYLQGDGTTPWNRDSHQIISPGEDGEFGFAVAGNPAARLTYSSGEEMPAGRQEEADNLANFQPGQTLAQ